MARYVRLFLRKTAAWHRINRLGYYGDIADLNSAVETLLQKQELPERRTEPQISPGELQPPEGTTLAEAYTFADGSAEHITTLEEASSLLLLDELKSIAKEAKVQGKNKSELLRSLRRTSGKQTSLDFAGLKRSDTEESYNSPVPESRDQSPEKRDPATANRDEHYTLKILAETGPCIRLSIATFKLFERVHLIFYRSTEWTEKSLTTIILARIARWNFPEYIVSRSANIFASRSLVLEFEASLRTQFKIDTILEFNGTPTRENLDIILGVFEEILPRWRALLAEEQRKEDSVYFSGEGAYLRRLSPAWVYTRIVHKGAYVLGLGKFKDHAREHATLEELLAQRLFHHARRGAWYQRKALLEEHYMAAHKPTEGRMPEEQKKHWKRTALTTCEQGLQDNLVHLIYHYDLQKRVTKLEKALKVAKRQQHDFGHTRLAKPEERTYTGIQIEKPPPRPPANLARTASNGSIGPPRRNSSSNTKSADDDTKINDKSASTTAPPPAPSRASGKTIWLDPAEPTTTECSVEAMCLSRYRADGWKGFHSEGGILRTLFALLMYDVLFAYVPNVFQTPFQTCPLDLHTDAFYPTRLSEINARLAEISNGDAAAIIRGVWEREVERRTCVVGLRWDFELEDLLEIVGCMGGEKLATLLKVMAQEYAQRGGGVPDLFLWSVERCACCFAEVKSENDRLSDTQRMWLHVLAGAGIRVELCLAVAGEVRVRG